MKNSKRKVITGIFAAAAITGLVTMVSAADTWNGDNGDVFSYRVDDEGIMIYEVTDGGDGKVVVPGKILDKSVYSIHLVEIELMTSLDVSQCTELTRLNCYYNQLTYLDVSNNLKLKQLNCYDNQLTSLDVSKSSNLEELSCQSNQLTSLDVSNNTKLTTLYCGENQLTSLDLSKNNQIQDLSIAKRDPKTGNLTTTVKTLYLPQGMDVSKHLKKIPDTVTIYVGETLYRQGATSTPAAPSSTDIPTPEPTAAATTAKPTVTPAITTKTYTNSNGDEFTYQVDTQGVKITAVKDNGDGKLVVPGKIADVSVYSIYFVQAGLLSLDVSQCAELTCLDCYEPKLTSLDVSRNTELVELNCYGTQVTNLDVSKNLNLEILKCGFNKITNIDVKKNTKLKCLHCYENKLTSLDIRNNKELENLNCEDNQLTSLDLSNNPKLLTLDCSSNPLKSLDVSKCTALTRMICQNNQLTSLDISKNIELQLLYCEENQLTVLDVSNNTKLEQLRCYDNQLTTLDLSNNDQLYIIYISNRWDEKKNSTTIKTLYLPEGRDASKWMEEYPDITIYVGGKPYKQGSTSTPTPTLAEEVTPIPTEVEKVNATPIAEATTAPTAAPTAAGTTAAPTGTSAPTVTPAAATAKNEVKVSGMVCAMDSGSAKTVTIKEYKKNKAKVSIPATVKIRNSKYKVTKIAAKAFKGNKKLTQVTIGKNITSIGKEAFSGCSKLNKITVKSKVLKKVEKNAFKGISKKALVTVPLAKQKKLFGKIKTVVKK